MVFGCTDFNGSAIRVNWIKNSFALYVECFDVIKMLFGADFEEFKGALRGFYNNF